MLKSLIAGLVLAITASGASIQSLPDWEGHAGSLTLTAYNGPFGTGGILVQHTYNFIVGAGVEVPDGLGTFAINISNSGVVIRAIADRFWQNPRMQFTLNGPIETWLPYDSYWPDAPTHAGLYSVYVPPGFGETPEPATYGMMAAGLAALAFLRHRTTTGKASPCATTTSPLVR